MGNVIMIDEKTREELNPYDLTYEEKEFAYKNKRFFICKCCYPKDNLRYHFSSDRRLIPCHPKYTKLHDESCEKNEDYQKRIAYANPLQRNDDGNLVANIQENLFERPKRNDLEIETEYKKRRDVDNTVQKPMRFSALIKKLNLEVSYKQANRYDLRDGDTNEDKIKLKLEKDFSAEVFNNAKNVWVSNKKRTIAGCDLDKDGAKFFYNRITKIKIVVYINGEQDTREYIELSYEDLETMKNTYRKVYCSLQCGDIYFRVTYDALRIAIRQYENSYNNRIVNLERDSIIGAGYLYPTGEIYTDKNGNKRKKGEIDRLVLLMVNKYGVFSESAYEVQCFDVIMDYIMENGLYKEIKFYKPYLFNKNAYGDAIWLEDGVITIKGCRKVGIVEVFGMMGNEEYVEKSKLKNQYARDNKDKFAFLTWYPETETQEELQRKLIECIKDIKMSAYT